MTTTEPGTPVQAPIYQAVLLVRPEAWPAIVRWLPTSGLAATRVASRDVVPRLELTPVPLRRGSALTLRELDVLEALADGLGYVDIGIRLAVSRDTVAVHVKHIYRKLAAKNRAHAVHIAYQRGILGGT